MNCYVGTSGYSYPKWKGTFYPAKLPAKDMLSYYAGRFHSVEINNTFYRPPTAALLQAWAGAVPDGFRFVLKAPQEITHVRRLKDAADMTSALVESAAALKERLGPVLFQLPPNFRKDVPLLRAFLLLLRGCRAAFEFRHPSWFEDDVFAVLREYHVALCVADAEDDLVVPFVATANWGYVRLRRPDYSDAVLRTWAARIRLQQWTDAFVFFKHEDAGKGPQFASRLVEFLAEGATSAVSRKRAA